MPRERMGLSAQHKPAGTPSLQTMQLHLDTSLRYSFKPAAVNENGAMMEKLTGNGPSLASKLVGSVEASDPHLAVKQPREPHTRNAAEALSFDLVARDVGFHVLLARTSKHFYVYRANVGQRKFGWPA